MNDVLRIEFGELHDQLANHQPAINAHAHDTIKPGAVVTTRHGVFVHPDDAQRLVDVVTAAGWEVRWASHKEVEQCSA